MPQVEIEQTKSAQQILQELINRAVKKVGGIKENDICSYLPSDGGGHMHHFTMKKKKSESPNELINLIENHILTVTNPHKVTPKPRAARGSRKRRDQLSFSRNELERLLQFARASGDKDIVRKLTPPRKDVRLIKKELLSSIRKNRVELDLWNAFVEAVQTLEATAEEN